MVWAGSPRGRGVLFAIASSRETEIATSPVSHLSNEPVLSRAFCTDGGREDGRGDTKRIWLERG